VGRVAEKLSRLLPNVGGPGVKARCLYANTVLSVALYGAPVWADRMCEDRCIQKLMHQFMRTISIRIVRSYRTVSFLGTAGVPPLKLLAQQHSRVFREARRLQREGRPPDPGTILRLRREARAVMLHNWKQRLEAAVESGDPGHRVADAILPCFEEWISRGRQTVSFRVTQVLSGHGCFGEYLCDIGRERTTRCHHCAASRDSALHTLANCPAWAEERRVPPLIKGGGPGWRVQGATLGPI
jgi:hypothetical protein